MQMYVFVTEPSSLSFSSPMGVEWPFFWSEMGAQRDMDTEMSWVRPWG